MTYLISGSGPKRIPTLINKSCLENLSFNTELLEIRQKMIRVNQAELDWDRTLPAWQLYTADKSRLFLHVSEENWLKPNVEILILSPLFGWVKHTDLLPYYDVRMKTKFKNIYYIWYFWYRSGYLPPFIKETDIDLLFEDYRKAVHGIKTPVATEPQKFIGTGDNQGKWLNEQLNGL